MAPKPASEPRGEHSPRRATVAARGPAAGGAFLGVVLGGRSVDRARRECHHADDHDRAFDRGDTSDGLHRLAHRWAHRQKDDEADIFFWDIFISLDGT